jgi:hypothetical protein
LDPNPDLSEEKNENQIHKLQNSAADHVDSCIGAALDSQRRFGG